MGGAGRWQLWRAVLQDRTFFHQGGGCFSRPYEEKNSLGETLSWAEGVSCPRILVAFRRRRPTSCPKNGRPHRETGRKGASYSGRITIGEPVCRSPQKEKNVPFRHLLKGCAGDDRSVQHPITACVRGVAVVPHSEALPLDRPSTMLHVRQLERESWMQMKGNTHTLHS